ncbi:hypothetical protein ACELLULO517_08725 [Acidisoma cellulosilytica]|uniref:Methyltransferase n=1 Tax=Acidisoma cellulosilyticum TaxID=2802395 RepID=A0A963Z0J7_9PROT|nr:hypothetical protein [Acidisoma cellulosilyticum]MCB8880314.1 hypothetical protein [Acidisoma cellulosilyticum]
MTSARDDNAGRAVSGAAACGAPSDPAWSFCHGRRSGARHDHFVFPDGEKTSDSTLLFLSRDAIQAHLLRAGFTDIAILGDWDGSPMTATSPEIIVVAA